MDDNLNTLENSNQPDNNSLSVVEARVILPCEKKTYKTKKGAKWFGRIFKQYYYRCPNCGYYHLTTQKQPKQTFLMRKAK